MKATFWTKTIERLVHDAFSSIQKRPIMLSESSQISEETTTLLEAGSVSVVLDDESEFHRVELPPSVTRWHRSSCHLLRGAHVVGDQGHVFTRKGEFVNVCPSLGRFNLAKIRRPIPFLAERMRGPVFHLTGRDHENHGHFLMQHLPRLMAARSFLSSNGVRPAVLVAQGHEKWQGRYLGALGEQVVPCRKGTLAIEALYYVPMLWNQGALGPPHLYQDAQAHFRAFAGVSEVAVPKGKPIFVTREDAPTRRLTNEPEVIDICRRYFGEIDVINLRTVPFVEQVRRFADAKIIIGGMGQGLTSVIFSCGARMLILESGKSPLEAGWANIFRDFAHMTGNSALRLFSGGQWPGNGDWTFPAAVLSEQLERVVAMGLHLHRPPVLI